MADRQGRHHRVGPGRADRRALHRARQPEAAAHRGARGRRPADADDDGGELARVPGRHHGPRPDGRDARAGASGSAPRSCRATSRASTCSRRPFTIALAEGQADHDRLADHRDRRVGALARHRIRSQAVGPRRLHLRHLRRLLLPRQADRRRRRRRLGDGGGDLPDAVRVEGHRHPPPRLAARVEDHAGQGVRESQDRVRLGLGDRRGQGRRQGRGHRHRRAQPEDRAAHASCRSTACSSPSATRRTRRSSRGRSSSTPTATSSRTTARRRTCPACSRRATCRITSTVRRSPPPGRAAWRRSTPSATSTTFPRTSASRNRPSPDKS